MRRDQHPAIGPQLHHRRPLEFANIDIERGAAQVIAAQRIEKKNGFCSPVEPEIGKNPSPDAHATRAYAQEPTSRVPVSMISNGAMQ
jgi:hypothetical protein